MSREPDVLDRERAIQILSTCRPDVASIWETWRKKSKELPNLDEADLSSKNLSGVDFSGISLNKANLQSANLTKVKLASASLVEANMHGAHMEGADLGKSNAREAILRGAHLDRSTAISAVLSGADMESAKVTNSRWLHVELVGASLFGVQFTRSNLVGANLSHANARSTNFDYCQLDGADLTGIQVNSQTSFKDASVEDATIERHTLESLKDYGSLSKGARMTMKIVDGVAEMRASYSGFLQWIHVGALLMFVFPYAAFVFQNWFVAKFGVVEGQDSVALFVALFRYIWNGGAGWQSGFDIQFFPFAAFMIALGYNILRFVLLWKTKSLELQQEASGLPAIFSLTDGWGQWFKIAKYGLYVNLCAVLYHTYHFMTQRIPIEG